MAAVASKISTILSMDSAQFEKAARRAKENVEAMNVAVKKNEEVVKQTTTATEVATQAIEQTADSATKLSVIKLRPFVPPSQLELLRKAYQAQNQLTNALAKGEKTAAQADKSIAKLRSDIMGMTSAIDSAESASGEFADSLEKVNSSGTSALTMMAGFASIATVSGLFYRGVASAREFSRELANIASITEGVDLGQLKSELDRVNGALGSSSQLANAMYFAYSSGIKGSQHDMVKFTEEIARLNTAIGGELTPTMDAITTIMNSYGLETRDAGKLSDWFFQIVKSGKAEGPALASSLGQVVSTAAMAKIPLEELGAAISTLSLTMPAEQAIVALNMGITGIIDPTNESAKVLKQMGVEISATDLAENGLVATLGKVQKACGGNVEVLNQLFGSVRAVKAMAALTGTQFNQFQTILGEFYDNTGAASDACEIQLKSMDAQMRKLGVDFERELEHASSLIKPVIDVIAGMDTNMKNAITTAVGVSAALGGVALAIKGVTVAWNALGVAWKTNPMGVILTGVAAGIAGVSAAISLLVESTDELIEKLEKAEKLSSKKSEMTLGKNDAALLQMKRLEQLAQNPQGNIYGNEAQNLIEKLTRHYGDLGLSIDKTTGKIKGMNAAQNKLRESMQEKTIKTLSLAIDAKDSSLDKRKVEKFNKDAEELDVDLNDLSNDAVAQSWKDVGGYDKNADSIKLNKVKYNIARYKDNGATFGAEDAELERMREQLNAARRGDRSAYSSKWRSKDETLKERIDAENKATEKRLEAKRANDAKIAELERKNEEAMKSETQKKIDAINKESEEIKNAYEERLKILEAEGGKEEEFKAAGVRFEELMSKQRERIRKIEDEQAKKAEEKKLRESEAAKRKKETADRKHISEQKKINSELEKQAKSREAFAVQNRKEKILLASDQEKLSTDKKTKAFDTVVASYTQAGAFDEALRLVNRALAEQAKAVNEIKVEYGRAVADVNKDGKRTTEENEKIARLRGEWMERLKKEERMKSTLENIQKSAAVKREKSETMGNFSADILSRSLGAMKPMIDTAAATKKLVQLQIENNRILKDAGLTF